MKKYVFIHGLGQNSETWTKTTEALSDTINSIISLDLNEILSGQDITYTNMYNSFKEYCDKITDDGVNLCGLSLGGILALNYAIENPERVESLVLIGTQYKMPRTLLKIQNIIFHAMPKRAFRNMNFDKKDLIKLTNSMIDLDFSQDLDKITCPTLLICGKKDTANIKALKNLVKEINGAQIQIIDNVGHEVNKDNPEKLACNLKLFYMRVMG